MMETQKELSREEYIESELSKWKEKYIIEFKDEFDLKAMLSLQYQFMDTPPVHIKSLGDIIHTRNQIVKNLNIKTKNNNEKQIKILVLADVGKKCELYQMFKSLLNSSIISDIENREIESKNALVRFTSNPDVARGYRANYVIDLLNQTKKNN